MSKDIPANLVDYAKFLRDAKVLRCKEIIMADKRVDSFKGAHALKALLSKEGEKKFAGTVTDEVTARRVLHEMLDAGIFLRVVPVNNSRFFQPDTSRTWSDEAVYAWVYEGSQLKAILMGIGILALVFAIPLYPLWPYHIRIATWYLLMLGVGFVGFIGILAVIRAIVFVITYFSVKPGLWLFPRLFDESVGIVDSFIPVWEWHKQSPSN